MRKIVMSALLLVALTGMTGCPGGATGPPLPKGVTPASATAGDWMEGAVAMGYIAYNSLNRLTAQLTDDLVIDAATNFRIGVRLDEALEGLKLARSLAHTDMQGAQAAFTGARLILDVIERELAARKGGRV